MGRRNISAAIPQRQRSHLNANRELRMALKGHMTKPFGLRRRFEDVSEVSHIETFKEMQDDGIVSADIERRDRLHVTLLPKRRLDLQLKRGLVISWELGQKLADTQREMSQGAHSSLLVTLGEIAVVQNRYIAYKIESPELEDELEGIHEILGRFGLRAKMRDQPPLHATLGEAPDRIFPRQQYEIAKQLNEVMPIGEQVVLERLEIYPSAAYARGDI